MKCPGPDDEVCRGLCKGPCERSKQNPMPYHCPTCRRHYSEHTGKCRRFLVR